MVEVRLINIIIREHQLHVMLHIFYVCIVEIFFLSIVNLDCPTSSQNNDFYSIPLLTLTNASSIL